MSNVPIRLRNLSSMEHYTQAVAVRSFDGLAVSLFGRRQSDTRK